MHRTSPEASRGSLCEIGQVPAEPLWRSNGEHGESGRIVSGESTRGDHQSSIPCAHKGKET